ncbi:MAG: virulence RhuM family protein [Clostridia bacterium]|nr:virulence RhuM family protein [Clostridia bacterium]
MNQEQIGKLFEKAKSTINEHIKNIYEERELKEEETMRKFGNTEFSTKPTNYYNLEMIIAIGYRVKSVRGTQFRIWANNILKNYLVKGYNLNVKRFKNNGGGVYFDEVLEQIRDIRSSEKVFWRKVLDIYATSIDYDPKEEITKEFFRTIQNKMHYAVHGNTAAEVIFNRVDSEKENIGLTSFQGNMPTKAETEIAKNYLTLEELDVLNRLVSAYLDVAEINALRRKAMTMQDWIKELDSFLTMTHNDILNNKGKISHKQALEKAHEEYDKYMKTHLTRAEKDYLEIMGEDIKKLK